MLAHQEIRTAPIRRIPQAPSHGSFPKLQMQPLIKISKEDSPASLGHKASTTNSTTKTSPNQPKPLKRQSAFTILKPQTEELTADQVNQRFEVLFASQQDRSRLFEEYQPACDYRRLALLASQKQQQIIAHLELTQGEQNQLKSSIGTLELQMDLAREFEFQSALRGIDIAQQSQGDLLKEKRHRRNARQIVRDFECVHCAKQYGSEGSLNQHVKFKHP